ncbi:hypothetical protein PG985_016419 [Apiospora marii]|uniref:uncharacterized protein n=1 Tax=Apiospora marii TaxID=335849 RepID=UPI00313153E9
MMATLRHLRRAQTRTWFVPASERACRAGAKPPGGFWRCTAVHANGLCSSWASIFSNKWKLEGMPSATSTSLPPHCRMPTPAYIQENLLNELIWRRSLIGVTADDFQQHHGALERGFANGDLVKKNNQRSWLSLNSINPDSRSTPPSVIWLSEKKAKRRKTALLAIWDANATRWENDVSILALLY